MNPPRWPIPTSTRDVDDDDPILKVFRALTRVRFNSPETNYSIEERLRFVRLRGAGMISRLGGAPRIVERLSGQVRLPDGHQPRLEHSWGNLSVRLRAPGFPAHPAG